MSAVQTTPDGPTLGVAFPAFNEEASIGWVLRRVPLQDRVLQVVVDDGSSDRTFEAVQAYAGDPRAVTRRQQHNRGKGAAIRTGLEALTAPIVIVQDADLEDPVDYPKLIQPILEGRADVAYGIRGFAAQTAYSYWFVKGNQFVTAATLFGEPDRYHQDRRAELAAALRFPILPTERHMDLVSKPPSRSSQNGPDP